MKSTVKKQLFCFSLELTASSGRESPDLARTLCGDLYYLSSGRDLLFELRRTAKPNGRIEHLLVFYLWSEPRKGPLTLSTLCRGAQALLTGAGYQVKPRRSNGSVSDTPPPQSVWSLTRGELSESALTSPTLYRSTEPAEYCDLSELYTLMAAEPGLRVSLFLSPCFLSPACKQELYQRANDYTQLRDGVHLASGAQMRDPIADAAVRRLNWRIDRLNSPRFTGRWLVCGSVGQAAMAVSRLKQAILTPEGAPLSRWQTEALPAVPEPAPMAPADSDDGWFVLDEATCLLALPCGETCGLDLNPFSLLPQHPPLAPALTVKENAWALGHVPDSGQSVFYPLDLLKYHGLIVGRSGFGKTPAMQNLLAALLRQKGQRPIPMVIAPIKSEFRNLAKLDPDTLLFTAQADASPLLLNIFLPPEGVPAGQYKSILSQIFTAAFSMPDPLPALFGRTIADCYRLFGWSDDTCRGDPGAQVFSLHEFILVFARLLNRSCYSSEVKGNVITGGINRLRTLLDRCAQFDTLHSVSLDDLLQKPVVVELEGLEGDAKAMTVTLLLLSLLAYVKCRRPNGGPFQNLIVLDEAHALLNVTASGSGESASMIRQLLERLLLEARGSGIALCLADQHPQLLGSGIVSNTDFKLLFHLMGGQADFMADELGMDPDSLRVLNRLPVGQALLSSHIQPGLLPLHMPDRPAELEEGSDMTLDELRAHMEPYRRSQPRLDRPWMECAHCPAANCSSACRGKAAVLAVQMHWNCPGPIRDTEDLAKYLGLLIPGLRRKGHTDPTLCYCTAAQFLRQAALEHHIFCCGGAALNLLDALPIFPPKGV